MIAPVQAPLPPEPGGHMTLGGTLSDAAAVGTVLAELEERLEFAERLLAQSREPDRLQR